MVSSSLTLLISEQTFILSKKGATVALVAIIQDNTCVSGRHIGVIREEEG